MILNGQVEDRDEVCSVARIAFPNAVNLLLFAVRSIVLLVVGIHFCLQTGQKVAAVIGGIVVVSIALCKHGFRHNVVFTFFFLLSHLSLEGLNSGNQFLFALRFAATMIRKGFQFLFQLGEQFFVGNNFFPFLL